MDRLHRHTDTHLSLTHTDRDTHRLTETQTDTDRQMDRQTETDGQTDRQTHRHWTDTAC